MTQRIWNIYIYESKKNCSVMAVQPNSIFTIFPSITFNVLFIFIMNYSTYFMKVVMFNFKDICSFNGGVSANWTLMYGRHMHSVEHCLILLISSQIRVFSTYPIWLSWLLLMCQFRWATTPRILLKRYSGYSCEVFLNEIYTEIGSFWVKQFLLRNVWGLCPVTCGPE